MTHDSGNPRAFVALAEENQRSYALQYGYTYALYRGHVSGDRFVDETQGDLDSLRGGGLYWQKLAILQHALVEGLLDDAGEPQRCDWAVWMDSDVIVTNPAIQLEDIVETYALPPQTSEFGSVDVLLVPDDRHPVSGGVIFVRNTAVGLGFVEAASSLYPAYKDNILPEQTAMASVAYMAEPWPSATRVDAPQAHLHPAVVVLPHRAANSFPDLGRNQDASVVWQACDFVAHFAGVRAEDREQAMLDALRDSAASTRPACCCATNPR